MTIEPRDGLGRDERVNEIIADYLRAADAGEAPNCEELLARHPNLADELRSFFADHDAAARLAPPPAPVEAPTLAPGEAPAPAPTLGTVRYFGDYELLEEVARGGMGVVYRARQTSLNRVVALKMILSGQLAGEDDVQRFRLEAQTAAALQHPNIVAIHEVGEHEGQHYFSMDFVEGKSLADLVRDHPLPPEQAACWVRTIAQAIQYAHQQGTLHRDLKPSNVLIDGFGQPRVTDFGLAKRIDKDAGLTATGAVVGTPSYMPPEQASADRGAMGPASDVYSLGAVLYELVTGRPPFRAATVLDTLLQVREAEPAPPRLLNPAVSRDLETIILKCLQKDPARRYASARELADDLAAFLEGRPIKARRPGLPERALRWLRRQRRSVLLTAATAAASVVLVVAAILAWGWYVQSQQGSFLLTTDGLALETEVLDEQDQAVLPPFTAPTRQPVALPGGLYRLRLSGPRQMSETYQLLAEQGQQYNFEVGLGERQLWDSIEVTRGFEVVDVGGRSDLVLVSETGLRYLDGATSKEVWRRSMTKADQPAVAGDPEYDWSKLARAGWLVQPAPVLDADGTRYLVWAGRNDPWLLAVSARDGTVKWWFRSQHPPGGTVLRPLVVADADGDGIPDLIALFGTGVEAVSGRTGRRIWEYSFANPARGQRTDHPAMALTGDRSTLAVVAGGRLFGLEVRTGKPAWQARELGVEPVAPPVFYESGGRTLALVLSLGTLTAVSPDESAVWQHPVTPIAMMLDQLVVEDLDGDGKPKVLVPYSNGQEVGGKQVVDGATGQPIPNLLHGPTNWVGVEVLDGATGQSRWRRRLPPARLPPAYGRSAQTDERYHLVAGPDLDGDGHREVFTAALVSGTTPGQAQNNLFLQVAALSGADGRVLWQDVRPLSEGTLAGIRLAPLRWCQPGADGRPQLLAAFPGYRKDSKRPQQALGPKDLVARAWLYSAGTGQVAHELTGLIQVETADLDGDGIPDLIGLRPHDPDQPTRLHAFRGSPPEHWRRLGTWYPAFAGTSEKDPRTAWRVSAPLPDGDLDGDGTPDLLVFLKGSRDDPVESPLCAYSGKDGRRLWKAGGIPGTLPHPDKVAECFHLECRDLEKNGRPKVVLVYGVGQLGVQAMWEDGSIGGTVNECWLTVLSGSNGKPLWKEKIGAKNCPRKVALTPPAFADLNGDGVTDLVVLADHELRALDGRDGKVLWRQPLSQGAPCAVLVGPAGEAGAVDVVVALGLPHYVRHGGMGGAPADVVVASPVSLLALDGRDGRQKWTWSAPHDVVAVQGVAKRRDLLVWFGPPDVGGYTPHVLADLDGTGRRSVCLPVQDVKRHAYQVLVLDPPGKPRCTLDVKPAAPDTVPFRLWNHDLDGDGKEKLLFVSDGKVRAVKINGAGRQPADVTMWEWPLPGGAGDILAVQPAGEGHAAVVAVWSGGTVYGLDGATGQVRWRCDGPGQPAALLPGRDAGDMPSILFHVSTPESTVCRQAVPVAPGGNRYGQSVAAPVGATAGEDYWTVVPLPWEVRARQNVRRAALPGLACLALLLYAVRKRSRRIVIGLLACLLVVPLVAAAVALKSDFLWPEQHYAWGGWYWLWPYALSAPGDLGPPVLGAVCWLRWGLSLSRRRGCLVLVMLTWLLALLYWLSVGRTLVNAQGVALGTDGFTWRSPLVWMVALLLCTWPLKGKKPDNILPSSRRGKGVTVARRFGAWLRRQVGAE